MRKFHLGVLLGLVLTGGCSVVAPEKEIKKPIYTEYPVSDSQFGRSVGHLLSAPMVPQNKIVPLVNGKETFPAMLEALRNAKSSITIEVNIFQSGKVVDSIIEVLTERARAGVKVHMIVDALASRKLEKKDATRLRDAGVELAFHNPPHFLRLPAFSKRTHRKLMIIDGRIGFAGGVCLSDAWDGDAEDIEHWRDTHFRVEGPVVAQMQCVFMENWLQARSEVLHGDAYFPALSPAGPTTAHFFRSGPADNAEQARVSYLMAIGAAKKSIRLAHAYFLPSDISVEALIEAKQRGVKVEVILPAKGDHFAVARASHATWGKLLEAGIEFYEYEPSLYHCKIMIVDDQWVTAGSVNFDERSFRINDEANLNILSEDLAKQLVQQFEADKAKSRKLESEDFKRRNWCGRLFDSFAALFRSQM